MRWLVFVWANISNAPSGLKGQDRQLDKDKKFVQAATIKPNQKYHKPNENGVNMFCSYWILVAVPLSKPPAATALHGIP